MATSFSFKLNWLNLLLWWEILDCCHHNKILSAVLVIRRAWRNTWDDQASMAQIRDIVTSIPFIIRHITTLLTDSAKIGNNVHLSRALTDWTNNGSKGKTHTWYQFYTRGTRLQKSPCWISSPCRADIPVFTQLLPFSVHDRLQCCECHRSSRQNIKYVLVILFFLKISSPIRLSRFFFNILRMTCRSIHMSCCLCILLHV